MGIWTMASGHNSTAMGKGTEASGSHSTAMGYETEASGSYSTAMGWNTKATGGVSTAMNNGTVASGQSSTSMGFGTIANTYAMTAIGSHNWVGEDNFDDWSDTDPIFAIGIGQYGIRKNAMTVLKGGQVGLQSVTAPTYALELPNSAVEGKGSARATAWVTHSDTRVKSNQQPICYGLSEVMRMAPKTYFHHNSTIENGSIVIAPGGSRILD
jgi:hypothetical protein